MKTDRRTTTMSTVHRSAPQAQARISEPFTAVPNRLFRLFPSLKPLELRIMLHVIRETIGWHDPETGGRRQSCTISLRDLARAIGSGSVDKTRRAVLSLVAAGHLRVARGVRRQYVYSLAPHEPPNKLNDCAPRREGNCAPRGSGRTGAYRRERNPLRGKERLRATAPPVAHIPAAVSEGCTFSEEELRDLLRRRGCRAVSL